jgi:hypothetical protein
MILAKYERCFEVDEEKYLETRLWFEALRSFWEEWEEDTNPEMSILRERESCFRRGQERLGE